MVNCIVLLSGKRKSGKDYFSAKLKQSFEELYPTTIIDEIRLSGPLKERYAKENSMLLHCSEYLATDLFRSRLSAPFKC
jgi:phosphomevalonate kinase